MNEDVKKKFLRENEVDCDTAIENMMGIDTYDEILNDFYDSIPEELSKIDGFKNQNDMPNYAILVHAMKSNARSFGFMKLGDVAYAHEMASKANDTNYVNEHYQEFLDEVAKVKDIIVRYKAL